MPDKTDKKKYTLKACIDAINERLLRIGFKIAQSLSEMTGEVTYSLVNTVDDAIAQAVKPLDDWKYRQLELILDAMIDSAEGWITRKIVTDLRPQGAATQRPS
jgi:hypothetical protein